MPTVSQYLRTLYLRALYLRALTRACKHAAPAPGNNLLAPKTVKPLRDRDPVVDYASLRSTTVKVLSLLVAAPAAAIA